jgi:hypothetical protein
MAKRGVSVLKVTSVIVSFLSVAFVSVVPGQLSYAQTTPQLKSLTPEFIPEPGSPVEVTSAKVDLEVDSFDAPMAARVYLDYRNVGDRVINAVKFRVGYIDGQGKVRGTFHAPDANVVGPGSSASQKWRGEKVDPRVRAVKVRALQVKFADGSEWQSAKMTNVVAPNSVDTTSGAVPEAAAPPAGGGGGFGGDGTGAADTGAVPGKQVPQAGSAGAQSWAGVGTTPVAGSTPPEGAADGGAPADAGGAASEYESVLKTSKKFGSEQPAEDTGGAATYDAPPEQK